MLEAIASHLDLNSLVNLAKSTSSLAHLQPKEQLVVREDFSYWSEYSSDPEPFLEVEVQTRRLLAIKLVWQWQGEWQDPLEAQLRLSMERFHSRSFDESSDGSSDESFDESSDEHISNYLTPFQRKGDRGNRQVQLMLLLVRAGKVRDKMETFLNLDFILSIRRCCKISSILL